VFHTFHTLSQSSRSCHRRNRSESDESGTSKQYKARVPYFCVCCKTQTKFVTMCFFRLILTPPIGLDRSIRRRNICSQHHDEQMDFREGKKLNPTMHSKNVQDLGLRCHLVLNQQDHTWIIWILFSFTMEVMVWACESQHQALYMAGLSFWHSLRQSVLFVMPSNLYTLKLEIGLL
jgi:hypothetical protein